MLSLLQSTVTENLKQLENTVFTDIATQVLQRPPTMEDAKDFTIGMKEGSLRRLISYMGIIVGAIDIVFNMSVTENNLSLSLTFDPHAKTF